MWTFHMEGDISSSTMPIVTIRLSSGLRNLQLHHHPILFTQHQLVSDTEVGVDVGFPPFYHNDQFRFQLPNFKHPTMCMVHLK